MQCELAVTYEMYAETGYFTVFFGPEIMNTCDTFATVLTMTQADFSESEPVSGKISGHRNHQMDLLRILFASMVLLSHAPEITDNNRSRELFTRLTHAMSFGELGVDGFFLLSGFLIVKSWQQNPGLIDYLRRRILRIVPGYLVAVLLSTLFLGLFAPAVPDFFSQLDWRFAKSILRLQPPFTPPVFPGLAYHLVNGPLWTIEYEFRCYLMVPLMGFFGFLRRPIGWLAVTVLLLYLHVEVTLHRQPEWHRLLFVTGRPIDIYRLASAFFVGGCFYLFRTSISYRRFFAFMAAGVLCLARLTPELFEVVLLVCGGYLLFYLVSLRLKPLAAIDRFPDISYGLYLYGWPVEAMLIWMFREHPWLNFAEALPICIALGWLSWHFVERPMLNLKPRPTAPLPG